MSEEKIKKALDLYKDGKYKEAIDVFSSVLETEGDNAEIYNNIGLCYANLGDDEKAEKNYLKSQELNPKIPQVYINLADIYYKQKDMGSGIELMTQGIYELPDNLVFRHYLARFYMEDAKLDLAIDELEHILEKQPENYDVYYDLARVHFELGNYDCAIENFENVLEYKSENPLLYYALAQAYEANDEIDKAISNYLKTIAHNDAFSPAYKKVGILFFARGDYEDAIACGSNLVRIGSAVFGPRIY
jgi:tetratricopeptide (TPR) repeat protein